MTTERRQILDMLADSKIGSDEADMLLGKLGQQGNQQSDNSIGDAESIPGDRPRYFYVKVDSANGDKVNVRVPIALIRTGLKLTTMLPKEANEKLAEQGIDLSQLSNLDEDELMEALKELTVDVDSSDGDTVRIYCE